MNIGIVNDLKIALHALTHIVQSMPNVTLAWTALDGEEAVAKCAANKPDLILMDLIMPKMDGVEATRQIMRKTPCAILVVTATIEGNASRVFEALGAGALDAVETPRFEQSLDGAGGDRLRAKIEQIRRNQRLDTKPINAPTFTKPQNQEHQNGTPMVLLGASTGGPQALATILRSFKQPINFSVVIVQHLDTAFVAGFRNWLSNETGFTVRAASPGDRAMAGSVSVASSNKHLQITTDGVFIETDIPAKALHKPSVDSLMLSAASSKLFGVAALLTGMGRDGATGLLALRKSGWATIVQDAATSVVWGMPGSAVACQAAEQVLAIEQIGSAIQVALTRKPKPNHV
ncbi:MAG: chemotaxis-specific protein-glutamate methyltransferase CheB [Phycisphaerales bacterium]|nr:chemotaxis-specific protein-glutamate methyltransferase CheB [Phycisphaerales bacterium]